MKIIEQFIEGRQGDPARCEDQVVLCDDFLALLDGATDEGGQYYEGMPAGLFAARRLARQITEMPEDLTAEEAVRFLSDALPEGPAKPQPQCDILLYSRQRQETWRIGTLHLLLDQVPYPSSRHIDETTSAARAAYNETLLSEGVPLEELLQNDPGRQLILPLLRRQRFFANESSSPWGYGVINGREVPGSFIEVFPVRPGTEVVFASDGYPEALSSLEASEKMLRERLQRDPLLLEHPPSTKGLRPGQTSFDDRAYLRFQT